MTDLEMNVKCAEALGIKTLRTDSVLWLLNYVDEHEYNPLHNDAQAMELVKRFRIICRPCGARLGDPFWDVAFSGTGASHENLNRAIVECVAKMQSAKGK